MNPYDFHSPAGIETAKELLAHHRMPIIYLTANSEPRMFKSAKETLPAAYLLKPFRPGVLLLNVDLAYHYFRSTQTNLADGAYVKIFLTDKQTHTISANLSHLVVRTK